MCIEILMRQVHEAKGGVHWTSIKIETKVCDFVTVLNLTKCLKISKKIQVPMNESIIYGVNAYTHVSSISKVIGPSVKVTQSVVQILCVTLCLFWVLSHKIDYHVHILYVECMNH